MNIDNNILLTISIPIYNGSSTINKLLDSIFSQDTSEIEVLISNNNSTDNTESIVKEYKNISYFYNESNVGADKNIVLSIERAKGTYVWVIGDDDYLEKDAISYVLNVLKTNKNLGALFVNFSLYDLKKEVYLRKKWLNIEKDVYCPDADTFLNVAGISTNFLSSVIHNKDAFIHSNYKKYIGTNWVQFGTLYDYLVNYDAYCIAKPFVVNAGESIEGEGNSNGKAIDILCNIMHIVSSLPKSNYSEHNIESARNGVKLFLTRKISSAKRLGFSMNARILKKLINSFGDTIYFWLFQLPLLFLPVVFHKLIYKIYKLKTINTLYWKIKKL